MFDKEKVLSGKYLFVVQYLQWRPDCTHPLGIVVKILRKGETSKDSLEIAYAEHGVRKSFKDETTKEVQKKFPSSWSIPKSEYLSRQKISTAFTIDPPDSRDLDDALSIESTPDSLYRVGIHIADVSYFVKHGSALDREATLRCTSYYPGHREESIPMIPRDLSEGHCSLLPDQDRLAVSLFLCLNSEGEVVGEPEIHRTIVHSCCRLTYAQAQQIIEEQELDSEDFPQIAIKGVHVLNTIVQKRRRVRLGDGANIHQEGDVKEDFEAHELVEEMMVLANKTIAEYLMDRVPHIAPLRTQLPPKKHRLTEWLEKHGKYLTYLQAIHRCLHVKVREAQEPVAEVFKVHHNVWTEICKAAERQNVAHLMRLAYDEKNQPQLSIAHAQFKRIQAKSRYVCAGDQPDENIVHYSLGMPKYTQFTSPIRRYADIMVHRLVLAIQSGDHVNDRFPPEEIARICRRCTFYQDNARKFGKACKRIHLAEKLRTANQEICATVQSIEGGHVNLHIESSEYDLLGGREKKLTISKLNPLDKTNPKEGKDEECIELKWRLRMYHAPQETSKTTPSGRADGGNADKIGSSAAKAMLSDDLHDENKVVDIPGKKWLQVLNAVKSGDALNLGMLIKQLDKDLCVTPRQRTDAHPERVLALKDQRGKVYQHPHQGEKASGTENDGHFYDKSLLIKQYNVLHVQLMCHMINGLLSPDIQLLKLTSRVNLCLEHTKYPRDCFAMTARYQASRDRYGTIGEYISAWAPVLAMEAATEAVAENDSFTIARLGVQWKKRSEEKGSKTVGLVTLPLDYCNSRQLEFHPGDFICIRVRYEDCARRLKRDPENEATNEAIAASAESVSTSDTSVNDTRNKDVTQSTNPNDYWVGHCVLDKALKKKTLLELTFELHQASSVMPQDLFDGKKHESIFEIIHRTLPQRYVWLMLVHVN